MSLREDANYIINETIKSVLPDSAVKKALDNFPECDGKIVLISIGKAAWSMAKAGYEAFKDRISDGVVITKYFHNMGPIGNLKIFEAGHPIPDSNSFNATQEAINCVKDLSEKDIVLFFISGGGSALFEMPLIDENELNRLNNELLSCSANITEINTIRKRFSAVKGGKFARLCEPAQVFSIFLSDVIGDPLDAIASGPAVADSSSVKDALAFAEKYNLTLSEKMKELINIETPKTVTNVKNFITGSVRELCVSAKKICSSLGYKPIVLSDSISCTARDAGTFLSNIAQYYNSSEESLAFILGGETVVKITGNGLGGRNQELALSSAIGIENLKDVAIFSVGSDGTDGPTDAAGGYVDTSTAKVLRSKNIDIFKVLQNNDSYNALKSCDGLIMTGPTGTNVNDFSVLLIKR